MNDIKKVLTTILIYVVFVSVFGIIRSNIIYEALSIETPVYMKTVLYTSTLISCLISGIFISLIVFFSWFANVIVDDVLTIKEYCFGSIGVVISLIIGEVIKFVYVIFSLKGEIQTFNDTTLVLDQLENSFFMEFATKIDYISYILASIVFFNILYVKRDGLKLFFISVVISLFLFFTKYVAG